MNFCEAARLLLGAQFQFAKTMPDNPHWYTLKKRWQDKSLFYEVVQFIRENSTVEYFYGKPYQQFYLNGYKYWTMGAPVRETTLINKAVKNKNLANPYDDVATEYHQMFRDAESVEEDDTVFDLLDVRGRVLDVGCGQGLLLDRCKVDDYVGIDPSRGMLDYFIKSHPDQKDNVICCPFREFYGGPYDTVVSLYGSPSYISPKHITRMRDMLSSDGVAWLMFFSPGYEPTTHSKMRDVPEHYYYAGAGAELFGKYVLVRAGRGDLFWERIFEDIPQTECV